MGKKVFFVPNRQYNTFDRPDFFTHSRSRLLLEKFRFSLVAKDLSPCHFTDCSPVEAGEDWPVVATSVTINTKPLVFRSRLKSRVKRVYLRRTSEYLTLPYDNEPAS